MIYIIEEIRSGNVKIGKSRHPHKRLSDLQVANPNLLLLRYQAKTHADRYFESVLHYDFRSRHTRGEWFKVRAEQVRDHAFEKYGLDFESVDPAKTRWSDIEFLPETISINAVTKPRIRQAFIDVTLVINSVWAALFMLCFSGAPISPNILGPLTLIMFTGVLTLWLGVVFDLVYHRQPKQPL